MTLDQLEVFKTIIETGSFRAASERLNRAQSAVSYAVRQLESEAGTALFSRDGYRPTLTAAGQALLRKAEELLRESSELKDLLKILRAGVEPALDLSLAALAPHSVVLDVLCKFARAFPLTRLTLTTDILGADRRLLAGQTDLAVAEAPALGADIEAVAFGKVAMYPVIGRAHPLANEIGAVGDDALRGVAQIVVKSSAGGEDRTAGVLHESRSWRVSDFATKLELLRAGLGWGRMPAHLIEDDIRERRLKRLKDEADYVVPLFLMRRRGRLYGPAGEFLWRELSGSA